MRLDLVISVDTAVVHLAGALGKPVWVLNRYDQCWRWLSDRTDSPWYPTARLFRQPDMGDWEAVIEQVRHALSAEIGGGDHGSPALAQIQTASTPAVAPPDAP
jgi:ADP-heptose:LPS heptosyltransferase